MIISGSMGYTMGSRSEIRLALLLVHEQKKGVPWKGECGMMKH